MKIQRALSVRQPFAENILRGTKKIEYRSIRTLIRERVYIYASTKPAEAKFFTKLGCKPGDLPVGVLVGTVEVVACKQKGDGDFHWHLANPKRLAKRIKPKNQPQPVWFRPF